MKRHSAVVLDTQAAPFTRFLKLAGAWAEGIVSFLMQPLSGHLLDGEGDA